jgi:hypothetical protein
MHTKTLRWTAALALALAAAIPSQAMASNDRIFFGTECRPFSHGSPVKYRGYGIESRSTSRMTPVFCPVMRSNIFSTPSEISVRVNQQSSDRIRCRVVSINRERTQYS